VLRALAAEKSRTHREQFVGREVEAITLHTSAELAARGRTVALTENFLPVEIEAELPANRLVRVRVTALNADGALEAETTRPAQKAELSWARNSIPCWFKGAHAEMSHSTYSRLTTRRSRA